MGFQTTLLITALILSLISFYLRLLHTLPGLNPHPTPFPRHRGTPTHLLIVLGSGGHTAEMFSLLHSLDPYSYSHRSYLISSDDDFSALKAVEFETGLAERSGKGEAAIGTYSLHTVPRARRIHQSLLSTPLSALHCLVSCLRLLRTPPTAAPDLILLNGPGTAVIVVFASLLLRFFGLGGGRRAGGGRGVEGEGAWMGEGVRGARGARERSTSSPGLVSRDSVSADGYWRRAVRWIGCLCSGSR
ncbi:hypothetical protein G7Y79_00024g055940 [Physcia stellaris]|nr:hypothetical protein G7Y79_00024g055940 [Physcia stellaris]